MRRHLHTPSHLKVASGPVSLPQRGYLGADTVVVNHYAGTEKLIPAIPGFRTSAAFLTSLSANLRIDPDLPSPIGTPLHFRSASLPSYLPHSPLSYAPSTHSSLTQQPSNAPTTHTMASSAPVPSAPAPVDDIPQLTTTTATTPADRIAALRLIADSIAQQRQSASKALLTHPLNLAALVACIALLAHRTGLATTPDALYTFAPALSSLLLAALLAVRWATARYLSLASALDLDWLADDAVIVAKWGDDVIGALVLGWADEAAARKPKGGSRRRRGKAVVRAWTVRLKYRGKGVGEGLLEEAVRCAGERGADGVAFGEEHANSTRVLPALYNGFMDTQERRAEKALDKVADEKGNFRQRRSSPTWGSR